MAIIEACFALVVFWLVFMLVCPVFGWNAVCLDKSLVACNTSVIHGFLVPETHKKQEKKT
jgi:hypothetical protein